MNRLPPFGRKNWTVSIFQTLFAVLGILIFGVWLVSFIANAIINDTDMTYHPVPVGVWACLVLVWLEELRYEMYEYNNERDPVHKETSDDDDTD